PDNKAPMTANKKLEITDVTEHTISIQGERAKDDNTKSKDVRYVIGLTETDNDQDPWHIVGEDTNICKFTFKWLKPGTNYSFYVMAYDEAGNMTQYPGLDKSETTMTLKEIPWWRKI
ncbi:MAG: fibronectin type III domain-containing protein, partial [Bacteroidales bacterium]|nr:fibronectin type III domain-containing protein [Bacteroidales bacterium]